MPKPTVATLSRSVSESCHGRMTYLMLVTSAASVMMCYGSNVTSFKPSRKIHLMPTNFRPHYTQLYQVEKLKAQILRGLNMTSVPQPPTKKPPQLIRILHRVPVPPKPHHRPLSAIVWSEPVDTRKKMADRLLFRVNNHARKAPTSINRVSLILRLRSSYHSRHKRRKRTKANKNKPKLPDIRGKGFQNDQQKRGRKKQSSSSRRKKSKSRRQRSRRVKVLVQTPSSQSGKFRRVAVQRVVIDKKFRWVKMPIPASVVSRAMQSTNRSLVLRVRCKRCEKGGVSIDSAIPRKKRRLKAVGSSEDVLLNPYRPYLVIFTAKTPHPTHATPAPSRFARQVNSLCPIPSDTPMPCCADRLHLTFRELGWDHWIVHPEGFTTALCRGGCPGSKTGITPLEEEGVSTHGHRDSSNDGRSMKQVDEVTVTSTSHRKSEDIEADTCQPQGLSSLAVTYYSDQNTLVHSVVPQFLSDTCSCVPK